MGFTGISNDGILELRGNTTFAGGGSYSGAGVMVPYANVTVNGDTAIDTTINFATTASVTVNSATGLNLRGTTYFTGGTYWGDMAKFVSTAP